MNEYKYDDEIFKIIFSCYGGKEDINFRYIIKTYFQNFIIERIEDYNPPLFVFINKRNNKFPALYYNYPDSFAQSFFFQVYRKKIVSKYLESNEVISFLRKNKISNDILISNILFHKIYDDEKKFIYPFGFFSLDLLLENPTIVETEKKNQIKNNLLYYLLNQNCDIFSDFMYNGKSTRTCLVDISNYFSNIYKDNINLLADENPI